MRARVLLTGLAFVALAAPPAAASCAVPGVYASRAWARPGETVQVRVLGGRGAACNIPSSGPDTVITVTLYLSRPGARVDLATFEQHGYGHDLRVRVPRATPEGLWRLRTDSGLSDEELFRVGDPPLLPRTATPATLPLAAAGAWCLVAGAYAVLRARRPTSRADRRDVPGPGWGARRVGTR